MGDILRGSTVFAGSWAEWTRTGSIDLQHEPQIKPQGKRPGWSTMGNEWQLVDEDGHKRPKARLFQEERRCSTSRKEERSSERKISTVSPFIPNLFIFLHFPLHPLAFSTPTLLAMDHEKSKYVHKVKQLVNLWNTLPMRSTALYSIQLEEKSKKKKGREKKGKKHTHNVGHHFRKDIQYPWAFSFRTDE